ncbi:extensin-like isoform X3 [Pomacea canaliculata]|uniref:extensin-like isoform X3 n=1 Tax=Pomacea canaliculata TaxID=400727 RepID=UPI000D7335AE|nr:extensin-like isoform X3 [Pomacea canaliculata]
MATFGYVPSQFQQQEKSSLEAAAEAAAKVNAMLIAKGKLRPNQVNNSQQNHKKASSNNMVAAEVEINDAPLALRNMLTRGPTQEEITKFSGAAVSTRGRYMTPVEKGKNTGERPLYLYVQGPTQDSVNVAVQRINEILTGGKNGNGTGGGLVRTPGPGPPHPPGPPPGPGLLPVPGIPMPPVHQPPPMLAAPIQPPELQQITVVEEKLYIGLEHAPPSFDVKNKILGPGGSYLMHIQAETGAKVMLRGRASGVPELSTGRESYEPMHIHIQHPSMLGLQQAKQLAENLIQTVQQTYATFQQALAALPSPAVVPGPTAFITGIPQPTSISEAALMGPPPGMAGLTGLPDSQLVQSASGLQPTQTVIVPSSSISSVIMPAGTIASLSAINPALGNHGGQPGAPGVMLPTTLSLTSVPIVSTMPITTQTHILQAPHGALDIGQQQLIMNQVPAPQSLAQMSLAPQMSAPTSLPVSMASLVSMPSQLPPAASYPGLQATMHLMSQAAPSSVPPGLGPPSPMAGPPPGPAPPFQTIYSAEQVGSGPPYNPMSTSLLISTSPSSVIYSVAASSSLVTNTPTKDVEPMRRRFTEEKDDKIPENLLGYQHGPPHLVNLVCPSPPPQGQPGMPPGQPGLPPGAPTLSQGQSGLPPHQSGLPPGHPGHLTLLQAPGTLPPGQPPMQPGLQPGHLGLQPGLGHVHHGIPTSFAVQSLHAIPGHPGPPPPGAPPVSQTYLLPPSSISDDGRFTMSAINTAAGLMPPPPPPVAVPPPNGEVVPGGREHSKHLMPPPSSRPEKHRSSPSGGGKRNASNGDRGSEQDRKRRKAETGSDEEEGRSQSPSVHRDSPKPEAPGQVYQASSPAYSPTREQSPGPPQLPSPLPQHPHYQQFDPSQGLPPHMVHTLPAVSHGPPPFDQQVPPPPPHQHFMEPGAQPPPPPLQYQEIAHQFPPPGPHGPLVGHNQAELMVASVSQAPPSHSPYPPFSQTYSPSAPPSQYIVSHPAATPLGYTTPQFMPQHPGQAPRLHPHQGPPPPPPPVSSPHYHPVHAPPQAYWHT